MSCNYEVARGSSEVKASLVILVLALIAVAGGLSLSAVKAFEVPSFAQSDRPLSFVNDAMQLDMTRYATTENHWSYATEDVASTIDVVSYSLVSEDTKIRVGCEYTYLGEGLWFVTINVGGDTTSLPLCLQPSANIFDRSKDLLERYQEWTGNSSLKEIIDTLDAVDVTRNSTLLLGDLELTVASSAYFTSFYWEYKINGIEYRGLGITFYEKYVFFRDDRNLSLPPRAPPATRLE